MCNNFGVFTQNFAYRLLVISREETHKLTISRRTMMYDEYKILSLYLQRAIPDMIYLDKMTANACMLAAYLSFMYSTYTSQPQSFQRNIIHEIIYINRFDHSVCSGSNSNTSCVVHIRCVQDKMNCVAVRLPGSTASFVQYKRSLLTSRVKK